ncbi:hypothetical protein UFOVP75_157 [uncultured Caudovirales phage]|uniref:Uncharacterized protein n=1 Tax=uncultured Caudovirales phage TaxID=2100421 RepID=A0A6J5L653_9CAUD|nr:hypothetical protein UFOVP75_157 [uncultured Caudovirales phage]
MAVVSKTHVRDTTIGTGTGNFTLLNVSTNNSITVSSAMSVNDLFKYVIIQQQPQANDEWEIGIGKLLSSNVLQRLAVIESTNGGALVNFSAGKKDVALTPTAATTYGVAEDLFGDGSDGDTTITNGIILLRSVHFKNVGFASNGTLDTRRFMLRVSEVLDLSALTSGGITAGFNNGTSATTSAGGSGGANNSSADIGNTITGAAGASGVTNATGGTGSQASGGAINLAGGIGAAGGIGGASATQSGGPGGAIGVTPTGRQPFTISTDLFLRGTTLLSGGQSGSGGGAGGGTVATAGAGGGGGGSSGGWLAIWARIILTGSGNPVGTFSAIGGNGGNGASITGSAIGGGGGGAGGGGGVIWVVYQVRTGPTVTGFFQADGGNGGNGGTANAACTGGTGGTGGGPGVLIVWDFERLIGKRTPGNAGSTTNGSAATVASTFTGTTGGAGGTCRQDL